jgi:hypothetical protein
MVDLPEQAPPISQRRFARPWRTARAMWRRFLDYDRRMTETIRQESREAGIRVFGWDEEAAVAHLAESVARYLAL